MRVASSEWRVDVISIIGRNFMTTKPKQISDMTKIEQNDEQDIRIALERMREAVKDPSVLRPIAELRAALEVEEVI